MPKICILLTATINPGKINFVERNNPSLRERDYIVSLKQWIKKTDYPLVFCENSGSTIDQVKKIAKDARNRDIEFLQFYGNDFPGALGKGYGELGIIKYALAQSQLLKDCDYIVKVTGRLFIKNIDKIIAPLRSRQDIYIMTSAWRPPVLSRGKNWLDSRIFAFKPAFAYDFLFATHNSIDDSKRYNIEHALADVVSLVERKGFCCAKFPYLPKVIGYAGGFNFRYNIFFNINLIKMNLYDELGKHKTYSVVVIKGLLKNVYLFLKKICFKIN